MTQKMYVILFLVAYVIANAIGDYYTKKWTLTGSSRILIAASAFYAINFVTWFCLLKVNSHLGKMATAWQMAGLVVAIALSQLVFHEPMTWTSWTAVALGLAALVFTMI
jgi:hypothetical protein